MTRMTSARRGLRASTALSALLLIEAGLLTTPAMAQDTPPTDPPATDVSVPSGPVESQPTPGTSAEGEDVDASQDIVVTGSRIPQPNLEAQAPVTVVTNQDIKLSGTTRVEDMLNSLPSVSAEQASGVSNASTGTATVDLRGLGSKRTMVLINGRRMVPGDPFTPSSADLNFIPSALVRRVEVLTGGASSTYGADAVAGVVNFIMDTSFSGLRLDGTYSFYQHNNNNKITPPLLDARANAGFEGFDYPTGSVRDGTAYDATVSFGAGFDDDRGHALAYFGYRKVKPVTQDRRDYSACNIQIADGGGDGFTPGSPPQCGGSLTNAFGTVFWYVPTETDDGAIVATSTLGLLGAGTLAQGVQERYNYAPTNYFQRPDERYVAGAFANYEISNQLKPYLEFMFMDDQTLAQIAPSGNFGNTFTINCDNPLLTAAVRNQLCVANGGFNLVSDFLGPFPLVVGQTVNDDDPANDGPINFIDPTTGLTYNRAYFNPLRRNVEGGPRIDDLQHTAYRAVLGMRGDLSNVWSYDSYFQYGRTNFARTYSNEFSIVRLNRALDVVDDPNVAGINPICRSVLDGTDPACVPYNIFNGQPISDAAIAYLSAQGFQRGRNTETIANFNVTGALGEMGFASPWAEDGVGINVGAEYRKEKLTLQTDAAFQAGDLSGQGAPTLPVEGSYTVRELFAEAQIPIVQQNFIEDLSVNLGYRKSWYKLSNGREFDTNAYKIGAEFAPIRDIRFRGAYNRAVRAPNIQELFATNFVGLNGSQDPCGGAPITAADLGCRAQGLAIGQNVTLNPAAQYNGFIGGNPDLNPEQATTKTIGVVLQPSFLPRFALTVDYFDIKIKDAIQPFGQDAILTACVANTTSLATPDPACALINRNPVSGSLWLDSSGFVVDLPHNVGSVQTKGFEFNAGYSHRLGGFGTLSASFIGTWLRNFITDNGITEEYDCAGYYGSTCSGGASTSASPLPKWRHKARATLATPMGLGVSVQWRRVGKVTAEFVNESQTLNAPVYDFSRRIKAQNYIDLAATYTLFDRVNLRAGVNNVFDREPPLVHSGSPAFGASLCPTGPCNGNTYPGTWDALGRLFYLGATVDFVPPPRREPEPVAIAPPPPPPAPPPATQTCPDGSVILATDVCPAPPPPPPPPAPEPERG